MNPAEFWLLIALFAGGSKAIPVGIVPTFYECKDASVRVNEFVPQAESARCVRYTIADDQKPPASLEYGP